METMSAEKDTQYTDMLNNLLCVIYLVYKIMHKIYLNRK